MPATTAAAAARVTLLPAAVLKLLLLLLLLPRAAVPSLRTIAAGSTTCAMSCNRQGTGEASE
jgi:hypothetical protein